MDKVASVRIPWPQEAIEFETRERKWPKPCIIKKIITDGCLLVHNPNNARETCFMEWKYTFSTSEQEIVLNFSPFQRSIFLVIKQIKRAHLDYGTSELGEPMGCTCHLSSQNHHALVERKDRAITMGNVSPRVFHYVL